MIFLEPCSTESMVMMNQLMEEGKWCAGFSVDLVFMVY